MAHRKAAARGHLGRVDNPLREAILVIARRMEEEHKGPDEFEEIVELREEADFATPGVMTAGWVDEPTWKNRNSGG